MSVTSVCVWFACVGTLGVRIFSVKKKVPTLLLVGANVKPKTCVRSRGDPSRRWLAATLRDSLDNIAYRYSSSKC